MSYESEGLLQGDCREVIRTFPDESFDACITDGPYGIGFMGREWDTFKPGVETKRVVQNTQHTSDNPNLKGRSRGPASSPSAVEYDRSLLGQRAFQEFTESWAREVYRVLKPGAHLLSFGAPRSHHRMLSGLEDAGFEMRDCLAWLFGQGFPKSLNLHNEWEGWGTALKPAFEPIALARKPFKGTLTANVQAWGTGALNIAASRVGTELVTSLKGLGDNRNLNDDGWKGIGKRPEPTTSVGRWPAAVILDEDAGAMLGEQSRFFYCPKVSRAEREFGCDLLPARTAGEMTGGREEGSAGINNPRAGAGRTSGSRNAHPTVKPVELMRWLVRLVTPPNGLVIDPFVGSGTTGIATELEGFSFVGIDQQEEWLNVAAARMRAWRERAA